MATMFIDPRTGLHFRLWAAEDDRPCYIISGPELAPAAVLFVARFRAHFPGDTPVLTGSVAPNGRCTERITLPGGIRSGDVPQIVRLSRAWERMHHDTAGVQVRRAGKRIPPERAEQYRRIIARARRAARHAHGKATYENTAPYLARIGITSRRALLDYTAELRRVAGFSWPNSYD